MGIHYIRKEVTHMANIEILQDQLLNEVRKERIPVTMFLMNGFQMKGVVTGFDNFVVMLSTEGRQQMVYKHAISTLVPMQSVRFPL